MTGAFVALALALERMVAAGILRSVPLIDSLAATSVGIVGDQSTARPGIRRRFARAGGHERGDDRSSGRFVEVQASAEGRSYTNEELQGLLDLAVGGIRHLTGKQQELLHMKFSGRPR